MAAKSFRYVSDDLTPDAIGRERTLLIAGPTGLGKTRAVADYANGLPADEHITAIAQYRLLTDALAGVLENAHHYEDADAARQQALGQVARLVTSISSLHKFERSGGLWIVDELEGVLQFIVHSDTFKANGALAAYRALKTGIVSADQFIGMDANLSSIAIDFIKSLRGSVTVKRYRPLKPRGKIILLKNRAAAIHTIGKLLAHRRGAVYVPCSSEVTATDVADFYAEQGYRVLKITRDTSNTAIVQAAIRHQDARKNYDLIVYTSAMGAGVDIPEPVYAVVGIFDLTPLDPEHALQLFGRVRNARKHYAAVPPASDGYPTPTATELLADRIKREFWTAGQTGATPHVADDYLELLKLWSQSEERHRRESARWRFYFTRRLTDNGYTVQENGASAPKAFADGLDDWRQTRRDGEWDFVREADELALPDEEVDILRQRRVEITRELKLRNVRYKIETALAHNVVSEQDRDLMNPRKRASLFRLTDLFTDEDDLLKEDRLQSDEGRPLQKRRYQTLKRRLFSKLMRLVAIDGTPEAQFSTFLAFFEDEHTASEVAERFAAFTSDEAMRLFKALGHFGNNARTIPGLCRWLLDYFGLSLGSRRIGRADDRQMAYQLDADELAYRLERARRAAEMRTKNVYPEHEYTFVVHPATAQKTAQNDPSPSPQPHVRQWGAGAGEVPFTPDELARLEQMEINVGLLERLCA